MPVFSIVIPTRARADTLRFSLRTALAQTFPDIEIIVHESGADDGTAAVLARHDDPRIRAFSTGNPVLMTENWQRALERASGDYVFFMGDDDGLLPDACAIAYEFFRSNDALLSWIPATYNWPDFPEEDVCDRLLAMYGIKLTFALKSSKAQLKNVYRFRENFSRLPMIYNNTMVPRRLIDRVIDAQGRYFFSSSPDLMSGVVNCWFTDQFALASRPLSIRGNSRHSTGYRHLRGADPNLRLDALKTAFGDVSVHHTMVPSFHLPFVVGNEFLLAKDRLFKDQGPNLDYAGMLQEAAVTINDLPGYYDVILKQCGDIAQKNGIEFDRSIVPPCQPRPAMPRLGRRESAGVVSVDLDGRSEGIADVLGASKVLHDLMPACDPAAFEVTPLASTTSSVELADNRATVVDFGTEEAGGAFLGVGWSYQDAKGVWSLGSRSEIDIPITTAQRKDIRIELEAQVFLPPRTMTISLTCGDLTRTQLVQAEHPQVTLVLDAIDIGSGLLKLSIAPDRVVSPAEVGMSGDVRRIGLFLQRMTIGTTPAVAK